MSDTTQLRISLGYPLHILAIEQPKFEVITLDASILSGCDLDCALAVSLLDKGTLYLAFLPDGRSYTVRYEAPEKEIVFWSPSSNSDLANEILKKNGFSEEFSLCNLRKIVEKQLGQSVDLYRMKRSSP